MPPLETNDRQQRACVWTVANNRYGQKRVTGGPAEITVRWNDVHKQVRDAEGNTVTIEAEVVLGDDEVAIGQIMWLGRIKDLPGTGFEHVPEVGIMIVYGSYKTPDIKGRNFRRTLQLMRLTDTLPVT
jgi:hypothetical protein